MEIAKEAVRLKIQMKDIIHGAWDIAIVAPFKFGMFLGELAGKEHKIKEKIEFMV